MLYMSRIYLVAFSLLFSFALQAQVSKIVTGKLIDQKTKYAVEEVSLALKNTATKATFVSETDDDGKFAFKNIPLGNYELHVTDKDYNDIVQKVELNEDHLSNFTFPNVMVNTKL